MQNKSSGLKLARPVQKSCAGMTLAVPIPSNSHGIKLFLLPPTPVPIISNNYNCNSKLESREICC